MEAGTGADIGSSRPPAWLLGAVPLALLAVAVVLLVTVGAPGLGDRNGVPVEDLAVERTELTPGEIALTVRNEGPDPVSIEQVSVNDGYFPFTGGGEVGRLGSATLTVPYPWVEGEAYEIFLLTSTGATVVANIDAAAETPSVDPGFLGLMALLGIYVGVIPVAIGMLWLPLLRRSDAFHREVTRTRDRLEHIDLSLLRKSPQRRVTRKAGLKPMFLYVGVVVAALVLMKVLSMVLRLLWCTILRRC